MTATTPETTVETLPYKNPDLPASERIADLLSRMTPAVATSTSSS